MLLAHRKTRTPAKGAVNVAQSDLHTAVLELLRIARVNEQEFLANLVPAERAEIGTPEQWCAKDVLGHITAWRLRTAERLRAALEGREPPTLGTDDEENVEIFATYSQRSWQDVEAEAERSVAEIVDLLPGFDAADLTDDQRYPWNQRRPLLTPVLGNGVEHPTQHLGAYCRAHGAPERALAQQERLVGAARSARLPDAFLSVALYNLACSYALTGKQDQSIALLPEIVRLNPALAQFARDDPDFVPLHEMREFWDAL